jgi:hypothetical protein
MILRIANYQAKGDYMFFDQGFICNPKKINSVRLVISEFIFHRFSKYLKMNLKKRKYLLSFRSQIIFFNQILYDFFLKKDIYVRDRKTFPAADIHYIP